MASLFLEVWMKLDEMRVPSAKPGVESASWLDAHNLKEPPPLPRGLKARLRGKRARQAGEGEESGVYRAVLCCSVEAEPDH